MLINVIYLHSTNNKQLKDMETATKEKMREILKSKGYTVSVDSRVWVLSYLGTWQEVRTLDQANKY